MSYNFLNIICTVIQIKRVTYMNSPGGGGKPSARFTEQESPNLTRCSAPASYLSFYENAVSPKIKVDRRLINASSSLKED